VPIALAVHGGAWNIPDEAVQPSLEGVRRALEQGWRLLAADGSALDVVERAVRVLEDDPVFDAGRGSRLNNQGMVEMDASIMAGAGLAAGAVGAIRDVRHPVSVARQVMERSPHVMLVGDGARAFALELGAESCRTLDLLVGRERERYLRVRAGEQQLVEQEFDPEGLPDEGPLGTVGAVALDRAGHLAAATSTGGTQNKAAGRVGDTPIIGAGTYADDLFGAASATGWGEGILRVLLTKSAVDRLADGRKPQQAARSALEALQRVRGKGGLIVVDPRGRVALEFNTPRMARGWATEDGGPRAAVDPEDRRP
jgi:beta-aspartyl-peptidase (threonine type)